MTHSLISRQFFRCATDKPFVRHDTRVWESSAAAIRGCATPDGKLLLGDELMADWRSRTKGSSVRLRAYVDVHPSADSRLTLDPSNEEPLRRSDAEDRASLRRRDAARERRRPRRTCSDVFATLAKASNGKIVNTSEGDYQDHPGGGCRMGTDPATSVVRQLRPHARSRESVRRRRADDADRRLHERDAHVRRADSSLRSGDRDFVARRLQPSALLT